MTIAFNADRLPEMQSEYVAWVDVMGTQVSMSRSIKATANFIFKLHIAAMKAQSIAVRIYPVMDGFYVSATDRNKMLGFLRSVFRTVAEEFNSTSKIQHRFMIRGGLAFGPVIHGGTVLECAKELKDHKPYSESILLGMPMVQAHLSEREAPPFGIFVHESARTFSPKDVEPLHWIWWRWSEDAPETLQIWNKLKEELITHLDDCRARSQAMLYAEDRIAVHKKMVEQYFQA